jgi:uncharacterized protein (DUF1330 family)
MTAYFIANVREATPGPDIVQYLRQIDATLAAHDGRFLVHGDQPEQMEGRWQGQVIVIAFPSREQALAWYRSDDYQKILPLRLGNTAGETILVAGVDADHRATDILAQPADQRPVTVG